MDEEGTEAAAATAVMMKPTAVRVQPEQPKVFKADHPFIFLIRDNATGISEALLVGPEAEDDVEM